MVTREKSHCFDADTLENELQELHNTEYEKRVNTKCFALIIDEDSNKYHHGYPDFDIAISSNHSELGQLKRKIDAYSKLTNNLQSELDRVKRQNYRAINKNVQLMNENELLRDELNRVKQQNLRSPSRSPSYCTNSKMKTHRHHDPSLPLFLASSQYSQLSPQRTPFKNRESMNTEMEFEILDEDEDEEMDYANQNCRHRWRGRLKWKFLWLRFQASRY